jgi:multiple sugar transport system permease protein
MTAIATQSPSKMFDGNGKDLKASSGMRLQASRWWVLLALAFLSVGFLIPFVFTLSTSLKTSADTQTPSMFPTNGVHPENFTKVLLNEDHKFDAALLTRNTLVIAALSVLGTTLSSALVAYGFAKVKFRGRGALFAVMLATMMIPFPVLMVSMFSIWKWLGESLHISFLGTYRPLWIPAWFGGAFNIFLLRQFFITIPDELSEAARIDGCSEMGIFFRVILPLARPALAVVALFAFMGVWNDYLGPLIFIQDPQQYTLALGLQAYQSQQGGTPWNLVMAASTLIIAPIVILFFLVQKTFIQGIATTGMKG